MAQDRPVFVNRGEFRDFDQFSESARGWSLEWTQLDRGPLDVSVTQVATGSALVSHAAFNRAFEQRGHSPSGARTFGFVGRGVQGTSWCGSPMSDDQVAVFSREGEFHATSAPGFVTYTIALSDRIVAEACGTLEAAAVERLLADGSPRLPPCDPGLVEDLRLASERVRVGVTSSSAPERRAGLSDELETDIPMRIVRALASGRDDARPPSFGTRRLALDRARSFIEAHRDRPIAVPELCRAIRLSRRTLEYAFREHVGLSPRAYLAALRLDGVRRELVPSEPPIRIADVANRWGFWHLGQFAADYRRQFGELPSETLRRRRVAGRTGGRGHGGVGPTTGAGPSTWLRAQS